MLQSTQANSTYITAHIDVATNAYIMPVSYSINWGGCVSFTVEQFCDKTCADVISSVRNISFFLLIEGEIKLYRFGYKCLCINA